MDYKLRSSHVGKSDFIQMSDFNDLTQKTDAALKANADAVGEKATATALAALAKNLGVVGHNARVTWGSYTGAGTYGASNQNSLEFGFCPVLVAITCDELGHYPAAPSILLRGAGLAPTLTAASGGSMGAEYTAPHGATAASAGIPKNPLPASSTNPASRTSMLSSATTKPKKRNKKTAPRLSPRG